MRVASSFVRNSEDLSEQLNVNGHDSYRNFILRERGLSRVHLPWCSQFSSFFLLFFSLSSLSLSLSLCSWNAVRVLLSKVQSIRAWCLVERWREKKKRKGEPSLTGATKGAKGKKKGNLCTYRGVTSAICVEFRPVRQFFDFPKDLGQPDSCEKPSPPLPPLSLSGLYPDLSSPNDLRFLGELRTLRALSRSTEISLDPRIFHSRNYAQSHDLVTRAFEYKCYF